jgi:NADH dehydrogenase [ubiquinone] 1 alpha subcomplex assembly factor 5
MTEIFDRAVVKSHLQRAEKNWAQHDFLWQRTANTLRDRLMDVKRDFPRALELGITPMVLTPDICQAKKITSLTTCAPLYGWNVDLVCDEEILPFEPRSFDLIISNNHLHWVNDLPGLLVQMKRILKPDGLLLFSMIGGETLHELRQAVAVTESEITGGISPRILPFAGLHDMASLLQRAQFALPVVDNELVVVTYKDLTSMLHELRAMGQSNAVIQRRKSNVGKKFWPRVSANYPVIDGRLNATVEVLYGLGWAPDASQPQALKRGSAVVRLADALGAKEQSLGKKTPS